MMMFDVVVDVNELTTFDVAAKDSALEQKFVVVLIIIKEESIEPRPSYADCCGVFKHESKVIEHAQCVQSKLSVDAS